MVKLNFNAVAVEQRFHLNYLQRYMKTMELQFNSLHTETEKNAHNDLLESGLSENSLEYSLEMSNIEFEFVDKYPQIFREQMLASIWGLIESAIFDTSEFFRTRGMHELTLKDLRGRTPQQQWENYFTHILKIPLPFDKTLWKEIHRMQKVRNTVVHTGGLKIQISEEKLKELLNISKLEKGLTVSSVELQIEPIYLQNQINVARKVIVGLSEMMGA